MFRKTLSVFSVNSQSDATVQRIFL